jgi:hypothetical protein
MLNLNPWVTFMYKYVISVNDDLIERDPNELRFICINIMCYMITEMVTSVLQRYTKDANIPKEFRGGVNMKNEFLFTRIVLSGVKKRYASSVRLREGMEIYPEKIDAKGYDFIKSTTREETKAYFMDILKREILHADHIDIPKILRLLESFEDIIVESLHKGEKNFLLPKSVKELAAYDDPMSEQGVRGIMVWNNVYPDQQIELPEKIDIIKVKLDTIEDAEPLQHTHPEIYDVLVRKVYENKEPKIAKKGVSVIGLPRNVQKIPDWILPYIDYDTITSDNLDRFGSVLDALSVQTIKASSQKEYFSNVLKI